MKTAVYSLLALLATVAFVSCDSDDEPVNNPSDINPPRASEFQAKAGDRIWTPSTQETAVWVTTDGQTLTADDLEPVFGGGIESYYFNGSEAVQFILQPGYPCQVGYNFNYDEESGAITFTHKDKSSISFTMTVESLSEDRMVVRDMDLRESAKGEIAYRRVVLVPVDKAEEQKWWDTYIKA